MGIENLSKEELLNFIKAYNNYVIETLDNGYGEPVSIYEFFDNDYEYYI